VALVNHTRKIFLVNDLEEEDEKGEVLDCLEEVGEFQDVFEKDLESLWESWNHDPTVWNIQELLSLVQSESMLHDLEWNNEGVLLSDKRKFQYFLVQNGIETSLVDRVLLEMVLLPLLRILIDPKRFLQYSLQYLRFSFVLLDYLQTL
jgi:hypothetical protein